MFGLFKRSKTEHGDGQDGLNCASVPPPVTADKVPKEPEQPKEYFQVDLRVKTTDRDFWWSCPKTSDDIPSHYEEFIKWYHTQKTMLFIQTHKTGQICFKRRDIIWYSIASRPENATEKFSRTHPDKSDK